jgi:hypothetical protein
MNTNPHRDTAKIYAFPPKGRAAENELREKAKNVADVASLRMAEIACDSGWYHEAAIEEAIRELKN